MKPSHKVINNLFSAFEISPDLLSAVKKVGYTSPTQIQKDAIPAVLEGGDVLASAETGSGKTAAFVLPLLQKIIDQRQADGRIFAKGTHPRALILVPTRELVVQIRDEVKKLAQDISPEIRCMSVYGGVKLDSQTVAMGHGVDVLIATPNRLLELSDVLAFNKLQTLVLDEADRLVDTHFKEEVEAIFRMLPNKRQNLLFTATFPESIRHLVRTLLDEPTIINLEQQTDLFIDQHVVTVNFDAKHALLAHLLKENDWQQVLVFCSAKKTCDRVAEKLADFQIDSHALHGDREQKERLLALANFKSGKTRVLIATDVASRGIDVASLDCVINFELPRSPNDYTHRIGRTGRAGRLGQAISLISHHEYAHFAVIEKRQGFQLEREQVKGFEASAKAPPPPPRRKPKKPAKVKLSKKKRLKLKLKLPKKQDRTLPLQRKSADAWASRQERTEPAKEKSKWGKSEKSEASIEAKDQVKKKAKKVVSKPKTKTQLKKITESKAAENPTLDKDNPPVVNEHIWGKRSS